MSTDSAIAELAFPAWNGRSKLRLTDVLEVVPQNAMHWVVYEFSGAGEPPAGMKMEDFEERVRSQPTGHAMRWRDLQRFAAGLSDTDSVSFAAGPVPFQGSEHQRSALLAGSQGLGRAIYASPYCALVGHLSDSTEWQIAARTDNAVASAVVSDLARIVSST